MLDISTDVFGPIQLLNYKSDFEGDTAYIITFTDRCTNYTKIYFTQSITSQDIIYAFESCWLKNFNLPQTLLTDNASYYISDQFTEYLSNMGILHLRSSIYNPTGNSLSERINSDIVVILKIYKGWSLNLFTLVIENRINNTYNSFLRSTPTKIITEGLEKIFELKDNSISTNALRKNHIYHKGDKVLIVNHKKGNKLDQDFLGPYQIIETKSNRVIKTDKKEITQR